jgi:succinate dehydrogenase / fumarate reductase flavoprotein subunit
MGGVHVNADSQMSRVPGLFAAGECASGINGANRLGGNSLSDLLVFGKRAGEYASIYARELPAGQIQESELDAIAKRTLAPFERGDQGEGPYRIQQDLQAMMQDQVGIVRTEAEMQQALVALAELRARAARVGVGGNREYNNGWHTALDLENLLTVSEAVTLSAIARKESRGGHFRDDYPKQDPAFSTINIAVERLPDGGMKVESIPIPPMPPELKQVIEENK